MEKLTKKEIRDYMLKKRQGDNKRLMKICGVRSETNMTNILRGNIGTRPEKLAIIRKYISEISQPKRQVLTEDNN